MWQNKTKNNTCNNIHGACDHIDLQYKFKIWQVHRTNHDKTGVNVHLARCARYMCGWWEQGIYKCQSSHLLQSLRQLLVFTKHNHKLIETLHKLKIVL